MLWKMIAEKAAGERGPLTCGWRPDERHGSSHVGILGKEFRDMWV